MFLNEIIANNNNKKKRKTRSKQKAIKKEFITIVSSKERRVYILRYLKFISI